MIKWFKNKGVKPGQEYRFYQESVDPWSEFVPRNIKIIDVKDGWVRYYVNNTWPDERMPISSFLWIYTKVAEHGS